MKRKWIKFFDIPLYMAAGVGLFSVLNLIFEGYSEVPALFVMIGLGLGLLMYWRETKAMKEMNFGGNIKALKFYVYLFLFFVHVLAIFGYIELFSLIFGQPSIEVYKSLTLEWEWLILIPYFAGWNTSAEMIIEDAGKNMNMQ